MNLPSVPDEIVALADERAAARVQRDYRTADELKSRIEAAGWKVIDFGAGYDLEPARPADLSDGERTLYGAVESVPTRLDAPATSPATVIVVAADDAFTDVVVRAVNQTSPDGTQLLVVTGPDGAVDGDAAEVIATAVPFGAGDALQAALRRSTGEVIVVLEPMTVPAADAVTPLLAALEDPTVAIAAAHGLHSADLHRYHPVEHGDATTVASGCYAFRRADIAARGPVDGRLKLRGSVAAWLGLLLRDEGPDTPPRRAVVIDLPLGTAEAEAALPENHARLARRDGYHVADRFRGHRWLAGEEPPQRRLVGDGAEEHDAHDDGHEPDDAAHP